MVEIEYKKVRQGFELKAEGHCRYAEKGKDIACAGVSTLIVALAKKLEDEERKLVKPALIIIQDGYALIFATPKKKYYREIEACFETVNQGMVWLSKEFEKNVKKS